MQQNTLLGKERGPLNQRALFLPQETVIAKERSD
jgi:hypothetical protein